MKGRNHRPTDPGEMRKLMEEFHCTVEPWCEENEFSLHQAFEISRESQPEFHRILSGLWSTTAGKEYLRSLFSSQGGVLRHPRP